MRGSLTIDAGARPGRRQAGTSTINLGLGTVANAGIIEGAASGLTINGAVANDHVIESADGQLIITGDVTGTGLGRIDRNGVPGGWTEASASA